MENEGTLQVGELKDSTSATSLRTHDSQPEPPFSRIEIGEVMMDRPSPDQLKVFQVEYEKVVKQWQRCFLHVDS